MEGAAVALPWQNRINAVRIESALRRTIEDGDLRDKSFPERDGHETRQMVYGRFGSIVCKVLHK